MGYQELMYYFFQGSCSTAYDYLGAHILEQGAVFRVFAPKAR